jgi:hypothetical protein
MVGFATIGGVGALLTGLGFLSNLPIVKTIPVLIIRLLGFSLYIVRKDRDTIKGVLQILEKETIASSTVYELGKQRPSGMFLGWRCFGIYSDSTSDYDSSPEISIYTTEAYFNHCMKKSKADTFFFAAQPVKGVKGVTAAKEEHRLKMWHRRGPYTSMYYHSVKIDVSDIRPMGAQGPIVEEIVNLYRKNKRATVFVQGVSGAGKSTLGLLVAKELRGSYCHDFNPTEPGDSLMSFLRDTDTDNEENGPSVVVLEEVDSMITSIHAGSIQKHNKITVSVYNKTTFNSFLDDMVFNKNVILILTSNAGREEIDRMDPSYLRRGRVDAWHSMMEVLEPAV